MRPAYARRWIAPHLGDGRLVLVLESGSDLHRKAQARGRGFTEMDPRDGRGTSVSARLAAVKPVQPCRADWFRGERRYIG